MRMSATVVDPLRVSQLNASALDTEIFTLLKTQLDSAFKYCKPGALSTIDAEINAALRFVLWKYSIGCNDATIGQQLLQLRYCNTHPKSSNSGHGLSGYQRLLYGTFTVLMPWLQQRSRDLSAATHHLTYAKTFWKITELSLTLYKVAALVNFCVFLLNGKYQWLLERLLGVRSMFSRPQAARQVGYEHMNRELLWHSFGELLLFVLPLINFTRLKNLLTRHIYKPQSVFSAADYNHCVVCGETPNNPRIIGCAHVFCYYCVQANYLADKDYTCPECGKSISQAEDIKEVEIAV